jgi:hypothetical protein
MMCQRDSVSFTLTPLAVGSARSMHHEGGGPDHAERARDHGAVLAQKKRLSGVGTVQR